MGKYLIQTSYTTEGLKGVLKEGGTGRRAAMEKAIQSVGGQIEAFYFAFGKTDVYIVADIPDQAGVIALSLISNAAGAVSSSVTPLITPEEIDQATRIAATVSAAYRPPGK